MATRGLENDLSLYLQIIIRQMKPSKTKIVIEKERLVVVYRRRPVIIVYESCKVRAVENYDLKGKLGAAISVNVSTLLEIDKHLMRLCTKLGGLQSSKVLCRKLEIVEAKQQK